VNEMHSNINTSMMKATSTIGCSPRTLSSLNQKSKRDDKFDSKLYATEPAHKVGQATNLSLM